MFACLDYVCDPKVCSQMLILTTVCSCESLVARATVYLFVKLVFVQGLMATEGSVESVLQQLDEFSEQLRQQVDPSAMTTFHTDHLSLTQRLATVGHTLQRQQSLLEVQMIQILPCAHRHRTFIQFSHIYFNKI